MSWEYQKATHSDREPRNDVSFTDLLVALHPSFDRVLGSFLRLSDVLSSRIDLRIGERGDPEVVLRESGTSADKRVGLGEERRHSSAHDLKEKMTG